MNIGTILRCIMRCSEQISKYTTAIEKRKEKEAKKTEYTKGKYAIIMPRDAEDSYYDLSKEAA